MLENASQPSHITDKRLVNINSTKKNQQHALWPDRVWHPSWHAFHGIYFLYTDFADTFTIHLPLIFSQGALTVILLKNCKPL